MIGLDVLGATASALQIVGLICSLGNRILDKPKDTKAIQNICADSKRYVEQLKKWEGEFTGDTKRACTELRQQLQTIIDDIHGQKARRVFVKVATSLRLYEPEFSKKFSKALEEFKFRMCVESKRTRDTMSEKLDGMTKAVEELRMTTKSLEKLPGVGHTVAKLDSEIVKLSDEIQTVAEGIAKVESNLQKLEMGKVLIPQIEKVIASDGEATRDLLRESTETVVQRLDNVQSKLGLSESAIRIRAEILPKKAGVRWYDEAGANRKERLWSLDRPIDDAGDSPQAHLNGIDLSAERIDSTYDEVLSTPHIADEVEENVREEKLNRMTSISPFVALAKRGAFLEQLHEYVPSSILQRLKEQVPHHTQAEVMQVVQTLAQEYRYTLLDRILRESAFTLPKLHLVEDLERAMLAVQTERLEISLHTILPCTYDGVTFPFIVRIDMTRYEGTIEIYVNFVCSIGSKIRV